MGILKNTATGRFHPIIFRIAPMPGPPDPNAKVSRYKSKGHHTEGFDTLELAEAYIKETADKGVAFGTGQVWEWDGVEIPVMVEWFTMVIEVPPRAAAG